MLAVKKTRGEANGPLRPYCRQFTHHDGGRAVGTGLVRCQRALKDVGGPHDNDDGMRAPPPGDAVQETESLQRAQRSLQFSAVSCASCPS